MQVTMTDQFVRWAIIGALVAVLLTMCGVARGQDEGEVDVALTGDGETFGLVADLAGGFDTAAVGNAAWWAKPWEVLRQGGRSLLKVPSAVVHNAVNDPVEKIIGAVILAELAGLEPIEQAKDMIDGDDEEHNVKGFKSPHRGLTPKSGDSRTGVVVDRHGCSVETSSSTTPITVDANFGSSGSAECNVAIGHSEGE